MEQAVSVVDLEESTDLRQRMREQISLCQPMVIRGALAQWPATAKWDPAASGFSRLEELAGEADVQVMVAPLGEAFYGDVRSKRMIGATFKEFLQMAQAASCQGDDSEREQLYLAQSPILDAEQERPQPLGALLGDVRMPPFLDDEKVTNINLWVSVNGSKSSTHYDPYQNVLCVVAGEKTVSLWDPRATPGLYPMALHGEAFNHSAVNFAAPEHGRYPRYREVLPSRRTVRVGPGDALFIPEGWWHQVDSGGTTIAVNIWWQSRFSAMLGTHMDAYYARQAIASLLFTEKKRRLASVLPYKTTSATSVAPPAPSESATPHLQSESANSGLPSTTASGAISRDPEEASPVTAPMRAKARKKRGGKKTVAAKAESYHFPDRIEKAPFDRDVGSAKEQPNRTGTGDQQAGRARNEAVDREVPSLDGSDAAETATSAKFASDGGSNSHVRGGLPKPGLAVLPPTEASSASENRHSEAYEGSEPPNAASESIVLENRVQTEGHAECPAAEAAEETVSAAARKRRRVVESLSTEEAQLLRALVLQAGTGSRSRADSGRNGTDSAGTRNGTDSGGTRGCQHCGSRGVSSSGGIDERSEGQLGGGAREASGGNRSSVERDGGGQETDVVAGVFATSQASKLQRVLLAMATAFPRALERLVLYGLSPVAAELLTTRFEDFDKVEPFREPAAADDPLWVGSTAAFFEHFYSVFEDRNAAMGALLDGKEAFAAAVLRDVLKDLQGVADVSAQSGMTKEPAQCQE